MSLIASMEHGKPEDPKTRRYQRRFVSLCGFVSLSLCGCCWFTAGAGENPKDPPKQEERVGDLDIHVFIGGMPTFGKPILPATDTEFKLKLNDTGDIVAFRWTALEESERKRVQKLYGLEIKEDRRVFGKKLTGVRCVLESGKVIEGYPIPERNRMGQLALRTCTMPFVTVYEREIKSKDEIEMMESDVFSMREIYERMLLEKPPGQDAASHLEYAKTAANMGLFKEAIDHLRMAEEIDPRTKERNADFFQQLIAEQMKVEGEKLYDQLLFYLRGNDYFSALDVMDKLDKNFPNHPYKSRWESYRSRIDEGCKTELNKKVVQLCYGIASDLIQQRLIKKVKVDNNGNLVPSIPGKQVTTKHGHIFRGTIDSTEANGDLIIKRANSLTGKLEDTTLTIRAKDVMTVQDVDLSIGAKEVNSGWDDLKAYITDTGSPNGLKGQMLSRIASILKKKPLEIRAIFDTRLSKTGVYEDGQLQMTKTYVTDHSSSYGKGSWLREGTRFMPSPAAGGGGRRANNNNNNNNNNNQPAPDPDENPDLTDDPAVWWRFQNMESQLAILRAIAGEKVFSIKEDVIKRPCPDCGAKGTITVIGPGGKPIEVRCPSCRGLAVSFLINYW
jgi:tetratricopeptide (TPR) repeat protein